MTTPHVEQRYQRANQSISDKLFAVIALLLTWIAAAQGLGWLAGRTQEFVKALTLIAVLAFLAVVLLTVSVGFAIANFRLRRGRKSKSEPEHLYDAAAQMTGQTLDRSPATHRAQRAPRGG